MLPSGPYRDFWSEPPPCSRIVRFLSRGTLWKQKWGKEEDSRFIVTSFWMLVLVSLQGNSIQFYKTIQLCLHIQSETWLNNFFHFEICSNRHPLIIHRPPSIRKYQLTKSILIFQLNVFSFYFRRKKESKAKLMRNFSQRWKVGE